MRTWLIIALLTAVALSGCASEETPETVDDTPQDDPATTDDGNETVEDGGDDPVDAGGNSTDDADASNETNEVPVVTFTADVVNGTAPLLVNFTLDVEDDSDALAWAFFVDGNETLNGTEVPAAFNQTLAEGDHNVSILVSDGEHEVGESLRLVATAPAGPELTVLEGETTVTGNPATHPTGIVDPDALACAGFLAQENEMDCVWWELDAALVGQPFYMDGLNQPVLDFREDCTPAGMQVSSDLYTGGSADGTIADAGCLVIFDYGTATGAVTVTIGQERPA